MAECFDAKSLGTKIKLTRYANQLTAEKLAEMVGISTEHMRAIEGGRKVPSLRAFIRICHALGSSADSLLFDSDQISILELKELKQNELVTLKAIIKAYVKSVKMQ